MVAAKKGAESFFLALEVLAPATAKPAAHAPALGSVAVLAPARELRVEISRGAHALALVEPATTTVVATKGRARRAGGRLLQSGGHDLLGQVEVLTQVLQALVGQIAVAVLPRESHSDITTRPERLHQVHDNEVGNLNLIMLSLVVVLLDNAYSLFEKIGVDRNAVFFDDEHIG
eukprot:CAMPEP_0194663994 /NCGR_PEP_ID=MMETSP0295-20121207/1181_1 /TAXON_ID=39354 /ORGANISM="Heterosigma akashiwo, Strain CCMP2393" /LENGTH=173 /DNA_ID=CAMNT_0039545619 /DNA_START=166 /DNA_END=687 /DNA_ORIENTATION=-